MGSYYELRGLPTADRPRMEKKRLGTTTFFLLSFFFFYIAICSPLFHPQSRLDLTVSLSELFQVLVLFLKSISLSFLTVLLQACHERHLLSSVHHPVQLH